MSQTIESQDISFGKLYEDYYSVPDYQREYVWGTTQVEQLLHDVYEEFLDAETIRERKKQNPNKKDLELPEYFVGSIVVCKNGGDTFELIDGQQRTTTTFLLLCAIRDVLVEYGKNPMAELLNKISFQSTNMDGEEEQRYRLQLQYADSGDILVEIAERNANFGQTKTDTLSIANIKNAYQTIVVFLRSQMMGDAAKLRRFYAYFANRVKIIRITTGSIAHALKIFETINDRGKALDAMDLLKNLMFMHASAADFANLKTEWKKLIDTLYQAKEKPLRFLRYYILATYEVERLKQDELYSWIANNADVCGYRKDPQGFVQQLLQAAKAYRNFVESKDVQGDYNYYIDNIHYASYSARQHFILLLAARHLPADAFNLLARNLENLFFVYIFVREATKTLERRFVLWTPDLRQAKDITDIQHFLDNKLIPDKNTFTARFHAAFASLTDQSIQKYRMRYILGKIVQSLQISAYGRQGNLLDLGTFVNRENEVEHILPQTPDAEVIESFDDRTDKTLEEKAEEIQVWIHKFGNLTWIEKSLNGSLGNRPYHEKRPVYGRSNFLLTSSLHTTENVGVNTRIDQTLRKLSAFEQWNPRVINERQQLLTNLACTVWEMPLPPANNQSEDE